MNTRLLGKRCQIEFQIVHSKMKSVKEPFKCGMRPSSLPFSLRYDAASCFDAARSARPPQ